MRSSRSFVPRLALALFGLFLLVSLPLSMGRSVRRVERAFRYRGESVLDERSRVFGAAYARAIEQIRRTIPPDGAYAVVNGDAVDHGGPVWVRFDLAPRRAVLLGTARDLRDARAVRGKIPGAIDWIVVAYAEKPPEIVERARFLRHLEESR